MTFDNLLIRARNIEKSYNSEQILSDFNIDVWKGSIYGILGKSGSGKTTVLRLLAGFERPDSGSIEMRGKKIFDDNTWTPPEKRNIGMVFQNFALFPHLNVQKNISFGLNKSQIKDGRLDDVINICNLQNLVSKKPSQLSGGEQQRVAIARALAPKPDVLLLDEPFSSLDAQMAREIREEIVDLLRGTKTTTILVTHNQEEALSICDFVSILDSGKIIQSSTPKEIYLHPVNKVVAESIGDPNLVKGYANLGKLETPLGTFDTNLTGAVDVTIRPECISLTHDKKGKYIVKECNFYGHDQLVFFKNSKGETFKARTTPNNEFELGDRISIQISEINTFKSKI